MAPNYKRYGENAPRPKGRGRNSVTGGGGRTNPIGARHNGQSPDVFHSAINAAADVAGAVGNVGAGIGRNISSAVSGFNARPQATGNQVKRALSDESTNALNGVLGKKR
jgi:hypothetical protein